MLILDVAVLLFAPIIIFGAFGLTLLLVDPMIGEPFSAIVAVSVYIVALKLVSDVPSARR
jgi:hypothetical protein